METSNFKAEVAAALDDMAAIRIKARRRDTGTGLVNCTVMARLILCGTRR